MTVETLALRCASCGASLAVPRGPEHVTCTFCGTALLVCETGGVAFLRRDVAAIREGVAALTSGVAALLDGQEDAGTRLERIERATRIQAIRVEMDELRKTARTPLAVGVALGGAIVGGLGALSIIRSFLGRFDAVTGDATGLPRVIWVPGVAMMAMMVLFAVSRWPGARRYAQLRAELEAWTEDERLESTPTAAE